MSMQKSGGSKVGQYDIPRMTLRDMLGPLFRHRVVVLAVFSAIFLGSVLVAFLWAKRYYVASMQVVVSRERLDPAVTSQPTTVIQESNKIVTTDDVTSEITIIQGQDMLREVVQACNQVSDRPSFWDKFDSRSP